MTDDGLDPDVARGLSLTHDDITRHLRQLKSAISDDDREEIERQLANIRESAASGQEQFKKQHEIDLDRRKESGAPQGGDQ